MIHIALVDDHTLFRNGLASLLKRHENYQVVGEFADGSEFIAALHSLDVDVVFMDISMPNMDGTKATQLALQQRPDIKIIALTMFGEEQYCRQMSDAGAVALVKKDSDIQTLIDAIDAVMTGEKLFPKQINSIPNRQNSNDNLTEREEDVLRAICQGLSTAQIAEQMGLSKRTVDIHRARILEKTGCNNTASLVVYAIKENLVKI